MKLLDFLKRDKNKNYPKELRQWFEQRQVKSHEFFPLNKRRVLELFEQGFFKGHVDNNSFQLQIPPYQMSWTIGQLPEEGVELILQSPYRLGKQRECAFFELKKEGFSLFQSDQTVGQERRVFELNSLQYQIQKSLRNFPGTEEIHIWHTHPFMEGIALSKNRVAVKIHPLSPTDIKTSIEINRQFGIKTTVHAVTKSSSHYQFTAEAWNQD
jgi:uncharacterized protein YcgL (UPF0745 family)